MTLDANGTRHHLVRGVADWERCSAVRPADASPSSLEELVGLREAWRTPSLQDEPWLADWDPRSSSVTLRPKVFQFPTRQGDRPVTLDDRRGAAVDRYGNWYWIDRTPDRILVLSSGTSRTSPLWPSARAVELPAPGEFAPVSPAAPPPPTIFSGLAVTADHHLLAGSLDPAGLWLFDLVEASPPRRIPWPAAVPFQPFDLAAAADGGVWILDRQHRNLWRLDRRLRVTGRSESVLGSPPEDPFQPEVGPPRPPREVRFPDPIALSDASPLDAVDPVSVEVMPDGSVLVLDVGRSPPEVWRLVDGVRTGDPVPLTLEGAGLTQPVVAHDLAFVGADRLMVTASSGNQTYAFIARVEDDQLTLEAAPEFWPMRLYGGKALVSDGKTAYYDFGQGWVPLVEQPRKDYAPSATVQLYTLDGREPDCVWHRLVLEACLPPGVAVSVASRAANTIDALGRAPFLPEPPPVERRSGSEQPFRTEPAGSRFSTWELLFQQAQGQYLEVRLSLAGGGARSPHLRAVRVYYPRFSYLRRYLPASYREDPGSASFLDRFLGNLEGLSTAIEDRIAAAEVFLDARTAPPEALEWLIGFFGVAADPAWTDDRRRLFIRHAMDFFRWRGTMRGLRAGVELAAGRCPDERLFADEEEAGDRATSFRIVEQFRTRALGPVAAGDPTRTPEPEAPRTGTRTTRWVPSQGAEELSRRWSDHLHGAGSPLVPYPVRAPAAAERGAWEAFSLDVLGFVPSAAPPDQGSFQRFAARRYRSVAALNAAYRTSYSSFGVVPLPTALPETTAALWDWYQLEALVLPLRQAAHRFSVLLPVPLGHTGTSDAARRQLDLVSRVVTLEKPSHTTFDVRFFWAMFRLGEARLGHESRLDLGSRSPELRASAVLGQSGLGEAFLATRPPRDIRGRTFFPFYTGARR